MKRFSPFPAVLIAALMISGCNLPSEGGASTGPQSWIDAPQNGSTIPLAPYKIVSHASDLGGISQIELYVNGALLATLTGSNPGESLVTTEQMWTPPSPGTYQLQARAMNNGGTWGDYAVVTVIVAGDPTTVPTLVGFLTSVNTFTPTPVVTLTPTSPANPTFTLTRNAFCRKGPDVSFSDVTAIPAGDTVDIQGVSQDRSWYFVSWKAQNVKCWVAAPTGQVNGDVPGIPVLASPNTPVPASPPTQVPTATLLKP